MRLSADGQMVALALLAGFVVAVVVVHALELVLFALGVRSWMLLLIGVCATLTVSAAVGLYVAEQAQRGVRLSDMLALVGVQLALVACLPARALRWRKRQCDRMRLKQQSRMSHANLPTISAMRTALGRPRTLGDRLHKR